MLLVCLFCLLQKVSIDSSPTVVKSSASPFDPIRFYPCTLGSSVMHMELEKCFSHTVCSLSGGYWKWILVAVSVPMKQHSKQRSSYGDPRGRTYAVKLLTPHCYAHLGTLAISLSEPVSFTVVWEGQVFFSPKLTVKSFVFLI